MRRQTELRNTREKKRHHVLRAGCLGALMAFVVFPGSLWSQSADPGTAEAKGPAKAETERALTDQEIKAEVKRLVAKGREMRREYLLAIDEALDKAGFTTLLDPELLENDTDLKKTREILATCNAILKDYEKGFDSFGVERLKQILAESTLSEAAKREFFAGYLYNKRKHEDEGKKETSPTKVFERMVAKVEQAVEILASSKWKVEDETIVFEDPAKEEAFFTHLEQVSAEP